MYRLLALDVDGTLLDNQHRLSPLTREAVRQSQGLGVTVCLATGKLLASVRQLSGALELSGPQIACNGAALMDAATGATIQSWQLEPEIRSAALAVIQRVAPELPVAWYTADAIYTDAPRGALDHVLSAYHEPPLQHVARLDHHLPPALKLLMYGDPTWLETLRDDLAKALGDQATVMRTTADFVEIVSHIVSKGRALEALVATLGVTKAETVAIGDGENDISLLRASGVGVAMGNAMPALLRHAQAITASANEDGVAHALTALGLATNGDSSRFRWLAAPETQFDAGR